MECFVYKITKTLNKRLQTRYYKAAFFLSLNAQNVLGHPNISKHERRVTRYAKLLTLNLRFSGAYNLLQLDLSANFLQEFPSDALRLLTDLKFLNISNNLITVSNIIDVRTGCSKVGRSNFPRVFCGLKYEKNCCVNIVWQYYT